MRFFVKVSFVVFFFFAVTVTRFFQIYITGLMEFIP